VLAGTMHETKTIAIRLGHGGLLVNKITMIWFWALTVPLLMLASLSSQTSPAPPSEFEIKEWPRDLRTDLRETSIKIVLPENALDLPWDDALIAKFHQLTGITVQTVRPGNDTTVVLAGYLRARVTGNPEVIPR
jgi:hypothetical protein